MIVFTTPELLGREDICQPDWNEKVACHLIDYMGDDVDIAGHEVGKYIANEARLACTSNDCVGILLLDSRAALADLHFLLSEMLFYITVKSILK